MSWTASGLWQESALFQPSNWRQSFVARQAWPRCQQLSVACKAQHRWFVSSQSVYPVTWPTFCILTPCTTVRRSLIVRWFKFDLTAALWWLPTPTAATANSDPHFWSQQTWVASWPHSTLQTSVASLVSTSVGWLCLARKIVVGGHRCSVASILKSLLRFKFRSLCSWTGAFEVWAPLRIIFHKF